MSRQRPWTWCFSTLGCGERDLPAVLELAKRFGCAAELRMLEETVELPELFRQRYGEPERLADYVAGQGARVVALDASTRLCDADDVAKEALVAFVPWAEALGVSHLRVFEGGRSKNAIDPDEIAAMCATARWWQQARADGGWNVDIMVETHDGCVRSENLAALQEAVVADGGHRLPILWDTHHPWHQVGEDIADTWQAVKDDAVHLHIKDSLLDDELKHGFRYVDPGDGRFPFDRLWPMLEQAGFDGVVSLEWERAWHPYLGELEQPLQVMVERFGM